MKKNVRKITIQKISTVTVVITLIVAALYGVISVQSGKEFYILRSSTDQYILCENAANELENASKYLTEQVRLYTMTCDSKYMEQYFEEVNVSKHRENALSDLRKYFYRTEIFDSLEEAMNGSEELMVTEYYAMRLVCEAEKTDEDSWPEEIKNIKLSEADAALDDQAKLEKAREMVSDSNYEAARSEINQNVENCMNSLIRQTKGRQKKATSIFTDMYRKLEAGIAILVAMLLVICFILRKLIVKPLLCCVQCVKKNETFPVAGAAEIQTLSETYNRIYCENQETQKLMKHQAEHDALTELLNRGAFEKFWIFMKRAASPLL